ncbi:Ephrin_rec_like domain-containing protein [Durusdinium trenchii]|uniref:Ephrin_rec_like domain-containing protein n=2 Tax=Durusdinium trenchii TaxID=1381693 RepID=A0ABP0HKR4_9DINO
MMVPKWSSQRKDHFVAAARFLVFRFRLDSWWFGVPLLLRGPLLSLPVVFATDYPPIQIIAIAMILSAFLVMQMLAWPWKVPMLNLTDIIVSFCVTLLVTTSSLHLKVVEGPMAAFAEGISTAMLSCIGIALGIMVLMTSSALIYRSALGGKKELSIFNLGKTVSSQRLATKLKEMSVQLEAMNQAELAEQLSALAVFDMNKVTTCITLLATEVAPPADEAVTYKFNALEAPGRLKDRGWKHLKFLSLLRWVNLLDCLKEWGDEQISLGRNGRLNAWTSSPSSRLGRRRKS